MNEDCQAMEAETMLAQANNGGSSIRPLSFYSKSTGYRDPLERKRLNALKFLNAEDSAKQQPTRPHPVKLKNKPAKAARNRRKFTTIKEKASKPSDKLSIPVQKEAEKRVMRPLRQDSVNSEDGSDEPFVKKRRFFTRPLQIVPQGPSHVFGRQRNGWNTRFVLRRASTLHIENPPFVRATLRGAKERNDIIMTEPTNEPFKQSVSESNQSRGSIQTSGRISEDNVSDQEDENHPPTGPLQSSVADTLQSCRPVAHSTPYPMSDRNPTDARESPPLFTNANDESSAVYPIFCPAKFPQMQLKKIRGRKEHQKTKFQQKSFEAAALDPAQMIIDAGQKRFGAVACSDCGMVYSAGDAEDEALHRRHHEASCGMVKFPGWKEERIVGATSGGRVVLVLPNDGRHKLRKVAEIRKRVERDLGEEDEGEQEKDQLHLIYVVQKEVVGYLAARKISEAYRVSPQKTAESSDSVRYNPNPVPAVCGISRIWVADSHRRKRVATRLLDCLRTKFTGGVALRRDQLAFSVPTSAGRHLAVAYTGTEAFLVFW